MYLGLKIFSFIIGNIPIVFSLITISFSIYVLLFSHRIPKAGNFRYAILLNKFLIGLLSICMFGTVFFYLLSLYAENPSDASIGAIGGSLILNIFFNFLILFFTTIHFFFTRKM